jgi:hypothetical protein
VSAKTAGSWTFNQYRGALPNWYRVLTGAVMAVAGIAAVVATRHLVG